jgi:uncharacterized membrane protein
MVLMVVGLVIFLGVHSLKIVAFDWRTRMVARIGINPWKVIYSLSSIAGFVILIYGYKQARLSPVVIWTPPEMLRHLNSLFTLVAFILVTAAYVPRNRFKARLHHPMLLGTKAWAVGHLLANGTLHDIILFGAFLVWAVAAYVTDRRRDRALGTVYPAGTAGMTVLTVVIGVAAWAAFAFWLHQAWIGVNPLS